VSHYLSLLVGIVSAGLMIISRLITNHYCVMRKNEILAAGTTNGFIPPSVSLLYVLGIVGIVVAFIWSVFNVGWWGPLFVAALYLATGFIHSRVHDLNLAIRFNRGPKI
jgi:hypothetical protein